jgi:hypothetical protein
MATAKENKAASQLKAISGFNAGSVTNQLNRALGDYDVADRQSESLANVQLEANSKKTASDRFSQAKRLQSSTRGILGAAGNALQGSQLGSLIGMLRDRNDLDSGEALSTLSDNQNAARAALTENKNATVLARRDAMTTAEMELRRLEGDLSAQLTSLNPDLYTAPGRGAANLGSATTAARRSTVAENRAAKSGYFLPEAAPKVVAPKMQGASYFDKLLNSYNQRSA